MKRFFLLLSVSVATVIAVLSVACHNTLSEDKTWSVTLHTTEIYDRPHPGNDTICMSYINAPAFLYEQFDIAVIDTMVQIPNDSTWWDVTFRLSTGEEIYPIHIYTYNKQGIVMIDNLVSDSYKVLRFAKNTRSGGCVYDWIDITKQQKGSVIYDTLYRFGVYY